MRNKLLIITHDVVEARMAGPAIRCWELARRLSPVVDVTVISKFPVDRSHPDFRVISFHQDPAKLIAEAEAADILLVQGFVLNDHPVLTTLGKHLVVDLYDPFIFESYEYFESQGANRDVSFMQVLGVLDAQMRLGDYFICANDRQRDMWLGRFCALGRLTPEMFASDPAMNRLLGIVPFGLPDEPVTAPAPVLRGVRPGIGPDDFILLWGGGVWNWFDPLSVIRAVAELAIERPQIKLVFMGLKHPNPDVPEMAMATRAVALAEELGVLDRHVFFNHGWVSYDDRQAYLAEADAGISAHFDSIETRFSFRTRVLDYLWAGLPVLTTEGDGMAELVARHGLGAVMGYGDVAGWKAAIARLVDDHAGRAAMRERVRQAAAAFRWSEVVKPLAAYCANPYHTPRGIQPPPAPATPDAPMLEPGVGLWEKSVRVLAQEGTGSFVKKSLRYLGKKATKTV